MKVKEFKSFDEYENYVESDSYNELVPTIIIDENYCAIDFTTYCKSWKTAIRRAMKIFIKYEDVYNWLDGMKESCENNCFIDRSVYDGKYTGDYTFGVEEVSDGVFYIYLKYRTTETETEEATETSETEEAAEAEETKGKETEESTASKETYSTETAGSAKRKTDNQTYNSMCYNCKKFLNGCRGEKNKIYSGCVYKEKMEVRNNG